MIAKKVGGTCTMLIEKNRWYGTRLMEITGDICTGLIGKERWYQVDGKNRCNSH